MSPDYDMPTVMRKTPGLAPASARRSREAQTKFWRVSFIAAFFIAVLAANLYVGAVVVAGRVRAHMQPTVAGATGMTASITHPLLDGTFCRSSVFDNNSARMLEDKI